jgi:hypothetical protein
MATDKEPFKSRSVPAAPWVRILTLMLCLAILALAAWEYRMRQIGLQAGDIGDGRGHWSVERDKLIDSDPDAIAIVGASRILFDTNLDLFEEKTGIRPVQLALPGTNARPFLEDLAQNRDFSGLVIVGITEVSFFREEVGLYRDALEYYRTESPSQRFGHLAHRILSRFLAFIDDNYGLITLLERLPVQERSGVSGPYDQVWKLSVAVDDRQTYLWERIETDAFLRDHARHAWDDFSGDPVSREVVDSVIESTRRDIARIRERGGEVVFVRPPSSGPVLTNERLRAPRSRVWDRLLAETGTVGIHFEDDPRMTGLDLPEWSHLTGRDGRIFTEAYVDVMIQRVDWLQQRLREH